MASAATLAAACASGIAPPGDGSSGSSGDGRGGSTSSSSGGQASSGMGSGEVPTPVYGAPAPPDDDASEGDAG